MWVQAGGNNMWVCVPKCDNDNGREKNLGSCVGEGKEERKEGEGDAVLRVVGFKRVAGRCRC